MLKVVQPKVTTKFKTIEKESRAKCQDVRLKKKRI